MDGRFAIQRRVLCEIEDLDKRLTAMNPPLPSEFAMCRELDNRRRRLRRNLESLVMAAYAGPLFWKARL